MSEWVIVAIPVEDDLTWKISSEKVPHLTILHLGEQSGDDKASLINQFMEHAASLGLSRFGLSVDRRGELGPDNADVLFFDKEYVSRELREFRGNLLKNDTIAEAYHSTDQYPEWVPHLTLGFPETPAKPLDPELRRFHWVEFDRIALWTGDYEGEEIVLESNSGMMDAPDMMLSITDAVDDALEHYGVRGMKWGVRRKTGSDGLVVKKEASASSSTKKESDEDLQKSADYERAAKAYGKASTKGVQALSNDEINSIAKRLEAEKKFNQLTQDQKGDLQKKVELLKLEKEYRQLTSERAMAKRSTGRKIIDSLIKGTVDAASSEASKYGKKLIDDMLDQSGTGGLTKKKRPMPFKVNPNKVTVTPTVTNGLSRR